jgi:hypothetical protein
MQASEIRKQKKLIPAFSGCFIFGRPAAKRPIYNLRAFARGPARPPKNLQYRAIPIYRPVLSPV